MNNILFVASKLFLHKKAWQFIDEIGETTSDLVGITYINYQQKDNGRLFLKRDRANIISFNHVDYGFIDHLISNNDKKPNVLKLIVIEDYSSMSKEDLGYFENKIEMLNQKGIYLIICSNKNQKSSFISNYFTVVVQ